MLKSFPVMCFEKTISGRANIQSRALLICCEQWRESPANMRQAPEAQGLLQATLSLRLKGSFCASFQMRE